MPYYKVLLTKQTSVGTSIKSRVVMAKSPAQAKAKVREFNLGYKAVKAERYDWHK